MTHELGAWTTVGGDGGTTLCVENVRGEAGLVKANSKFTFGHSDFQMLVITSK